MKARYNIVFCLLALVPALYAQDEGSFLSFSAGGGIHTLSYDLQDGKMVASEGLLISANYGYLFTPKWGFQTGVEISSGQSSGTLNMKTSKQVIDADGDAYELKTHYTDWEEQQTLYALTVPLNVLFRFPVGKKGCIQPSLGGALLMPLQAKYKVVSGEIVTTGYYSQWNVEIGNASRHGWTTVTDRYDGSLSLNPCFLATVGLGGTYRLSSKTEFYAGSYMYYGLNNMIKAGKNDLYLNGKYNSLFKTGEISSVVPFFVGIRVGVNFYLGD
jgi:OmpA-OmpF porin, OOP family